MNVAARMAAPYERRQRLNAVRRAAFGALALGTGVAASLLLNDHGPTALDTDKPSPVPLVILDTLGNDVARDCVDLAESQTGQHLSALSQETVEGYAATCALKSLIGPTEEIIDQIAERMSFIGALKHPVQP